MHWQGWLHCHGRVTSFSILLKTTLVYAFNTFHLCTRALQFVTDRDRKMLSRMQQSSKHKQPAKGAMVFLAHIQITLSSHMVVLAIFMFAQDTGAWTSAEACSYCCKSAAFLQIKLHSAFKSPCTVAYIYQEAS